MHLRPARGSHFAASEEEETMQKLTVLACLAALAGTARASDPMGVYGVATHVTIQKTDPPSLIISGAFAPVDTQTGVYVSKAGYMYYACPAGQEKTCAIEWADMQKLSGGGVCFGFGARRDWQTFEMRF